MTHIEVDFGRGPDARVLLGIGPEGETPVALVAVCPCEGVDGLVADLQKVQAAAAELHPPHQDEYRGSWNGDDA